MAQQYQGKTISTLRDAHDGDPEFQKGADQVVITLEDGSEKTVKRRDVMPAQPAQPR